MVRLEREVQQLCDEAHRLRQEVAAFELQKHNVDDCNEMSEMEARQEMEQIRSRYSAKVPIFKEDSSMVVEWVDFPPKHQNGESRIVVVELCLPISILLGESELFPGVVCVDEVIVSGNGELAGIREGDLLRACTACQTIMDAPTWQILAGGIGIPKTKR
jgi:hypothetical protein